MIPFLDLKKVNEAYEPILTERINSTIGSGWYLLGKEVGEFEKEYAHYIGSRFCIACANGLDALTLIFKSYIELGRLQPGDEIIVPANTYIATILAITENSLVPILVDADENTLQIDSSKIEAAITPKTRGITIVHLYGRNSFNRSIKRICKDYNLLLVEDNAQAAGAIYSAADESSGQEYDRRNNDVILRTGSLGDAAGHSFYPGKNLGALGDGGAVTTDDPELAKMVRTLAFYGSEKKYVFDYCGRNSRLDEIQAVALRVKLPFLDKDNQRRRKIAYRYLTEIKNQKIILPYPNDPLRDPENVYHIFPVFSTEREELQKFLLQHGIQTLIHYPIPPHLQKCYRNKIPLRFPLPVTERIADQELSIPISPVMSDEEVSEVIKALNSY